MDAGLRSTPTGRVATRYGSATPTAQTLCNYHSFFGIHATAKAGSDATQKVAAAGDKAAQTVKDAHDKAIAAAAYVPTEKAAEFVDKLGISPR